MLRCGDIIVCVLWMRCDVRSVEQCVHGVLVKYMSSICGAHEKCGVWCENVVYVVCGVYLSWVWYMWGVWEVSMVYVWHISVLYVCCLVCDAYVSYILCVWYICVICVVCFWRVWCAFDV